MTLGSLLIGILSGLISAVITHKVKTFKCEPAREIYLLFILTFLAHVIAETLQLSGTIATFSAAFTMNHYTYNNLSEDGKIGSTLTIETVA